MCLLRFTWYTLKLVKEQCLFGAAVKKDRVEDSHFVLPIFVPGLLIVKINTMLA